VFQELRDEEQRHVPPFRVAQAGGREARRYTLAMAMLLLFVIGAAVLLRRHSSTQPNAANSISTWKAPTDFLLQTPESKLLRTVPSFGIPKKGTSS
jgi:hypothetical protein